MSQQYHVPLLARLPLASRIRALGDAGKPMVIAEPDSALSQPFWLLAEQVAAKLALREVDYTAGIPDIVVA